jgi:hypothetical protein
MIKLLTRLAAFTGIFCCLPAFLPSCTNEPSGIENMDIVCFDSRILPLLRTSCGMVGCHDTGQEGFSVTDYESVMKWVVPGKPRSSELYTILIDIQGEEMMPPDQPLTKDQRMLIEVWIAQGAMHTTCPTETAGGTGGITEIEKF